MSAKEFTLTLHFVSCRLPSWLRPLFTEHIYPEMQALYKTKEIVEGDEVIGIKFNVKEPVEIGGKLKKTASYQVKVSRLLKNLYLYLPTDQCSFFRVKRGDAKIKCELEDEWFRLYYAEANRRPTLESAFR